LFTLHEIDHFFGGGLVHDLAGFELLKDLDHLVRRGRAKTKAFVVRFLPFFALSAAPILRMIRVSLKPSALIRELTASVVR